ncbi:efflux transporter outer membrane subunit [Paludibaculum fermentans]|uniref:efflux transporter outer membrane subunit n=1 Tax=Paludibaculum fermentans TaxID=1473598 RepID=UPI003EB7A608
MQKSFPAIACLVLLAGCAAPRRQTYSQPPPPTPPAWTSGGTEAQAATGATAAADLKWQEFFTDGKLRQVIELALANNRDLRLAALNVEKVQAQYRLRRAAQYPAVSAGASVDAYRMPADMTKDDRAYISESNRIGLQVSSWELDLFGRIRSLKAQALEQYMATEQGRMASQISLVASVASSYLSLAGDRESLRVAQATLNAQKLTYDMVRRTRDLGIKSDLDLSQALSQVQSAEVDVVRYSGQLTLDENALNLLVGASVPAELLPASLGADEALRDVAAGVPSSVLLRRPDILQAEHQLKAAYANIDVARAAFFPRIYLTGSGGFLSGALQQLFSFRALTWEFAPQVTLPIFDAGTRKTNYQIAQVDRDTAVADYEKAIQTAFREVSDSLSQRTRLLERQNAQQALVDTLDQTYRLTEARYKAGIDNYLSVLVAQRSLYSGQQSLVSLRLLRLTNLVTLYKVMGGGA